MNTNTQNQNTTATTSTEAAMATIANLINNGDVAAIMVIEQPQPTKPISPEEISESILREMDEEPAAAVQQELDKELQDPQRPDPDVIAENILRMFEPLRGFGYPIIIRLMAKYAVTGGLLIVESSTENGVFDTHAVSPVDPGSLALWKDWTVHSKSFDNILASANDARWRDGVITLTTSQGRVTHTIRVGQL